MLSIRQIRVFVLTAVAVPLSVGPGGDAAEPVVVTYAAPRGVEPAQDLRAEVNGEEIFVYDSPFGAVA